MEPVDTSPIPVVSFVGFSGSGKTTLIEKIVREFSGRGFSVNVIKYTHHRFEMDTPGKDSYRLKQAGAVSVGIISPESWAVVASEAKIELSDMVKKLPKADLIIIEGGSWLDVPQIEVLPADIQEPVKSSPDRIIALIGKNNLTKIPCFDRDDYLGVTEFLVEKFLK